MIDNYNMYDFSDTEKGCALYGKIEAYCLKNSLDLK